jgi:hypothetical protein
MRLAIKFVDGNAAWPARTGDRNHSAGEIGQWHGKLVAIHQGQPFSACGSLLRKIFPKSAIHGFRVRKDPVQIRSDQNHVCAFKIALRVFSTDAGLNQVLRVFAS